MNYTIEFKDNIAIEGGLIMNENIDLTKILKNCPKGWKFWSPFAGEVEFERIVENRILINIMDEYRSIWAFNTDATTSIGNTKSPEIMLYPSKYQRDWSKFTAPWYKKEKFDSHTLQPFDKILVRDLDEYQWKCTFYSHQREESDLCKYVTTGASYEYCIPYNEETKHLVGTTKEAPEYYRYWED